MPRYHHLSSAYRSSLRDSGPRGTPAGEKPFIEDRALKESGRQALALVSGYCSHTTTRVLFFFEIKTCVAQAEFELDV